MASGIGSVKRAKTSPAYLHTNSTSHTWIFSAIAELIDNGYDPDVSASELCIEKEDIHGVTCLTLTDNGAGMDADSLHKMLSFGYSEKVEIKGHKPIGHYGNGFKSGSMRLGSDAFVFTLHKETMSVGCLSQSYLEAVGADTVLTPIVTWNLVDRRLQTTGECTASLLDITKHSIFRSEQELLEELSKVTGSTGTRIIIYNLKKTNGRFELDFESKPDDIINPESMSLDETTVSNRPVQEHIPEYKKSLREYCSILYLKPRMKIRLRGIKVKTKLVSKSLSKSEKDTYKPICISKKIFITFGFDRKKDDYGMMIYHRNRLIKAYHRVGYQKQNSGDGIGVVGVVEADFLEPIHNKQDFKTTNEYNSFISNMGIKLNQYYNEKMKIQSAVASNARSEPWTWAQCNQCLKWRRMPDGVTDADLPEMWYCYQNGDSSHNRCDIEEEAEDENDVLKFTHSTYQKTYGKTQSVKKRMEKEEGQQLEIKDFEAKQLRAKVLSMQNNNTNKVTSSQGEQGPSLAQLEVEKKEKVQRLDAQAAQHLKSAERIRKRQAVDLALFHTQATSTSSTRKRKCTEGNSDESDNVTNMELNADANILNTNIPIVNSRSMSDKDIQTEESGDQLSSMCMDLRNTQKDLTDAKSENEDLKKELQDAKESAAVSLERATVTSSSLNSLRCLVQRLLNWVVPGLDIPNLESVDKLLSEVVADNVSEEAE